MSSDHDTRHATTYHAGREGEKTKRAAKKKGRKHLYNVCGGKSKADSREREKAVQATLEFAKTMLWSSMVGIQYIDNI
jgi:hypothetical protein